MNTHFTQFPLIETERLFLRRLVANDAPAIQQLRSNNEVNKYLNRPKSINEEECLAYIEMIGNNFIEGKSFYWVLTLKHDATLIGTICLWNFDVKTDTADLGYELTPKYQGKGLMNEAVEKVIEFGFDKVQLKMILGVVHPENENSVNILKRNGFIKDESFTYVSKEEADGGVVYFLVR